MLLKIKYFQINSDKIIFYPRIPIQKIGIVFFVISMAMSLLFLGEFFWQMFWSLFVLGAFMSGLIYFIGSKKIIIDAKEKKVFVKIPLLTLKTFRFDEVELAYVNDISFGGKTDNGFYKFKINQDPYAKGIPLHFSLRNSSQYFKSIQEIAIPKVENLLQDEIKTEQKTSQRSFGLYKQFEQRGNLFISKRHKWFYFFLGFAFIGISIFLFSLDGFKLGSKTYQFVIFFLLGLLFISNWTERIFVDKKAKELEIRKYFNLKKEKVPLSEIKQITTLRHLAYGMHNGTDILLNLNNGKEILLLTCVGNSRKIKEIIDELNEILH